MITGEYIAVELPSMSIIIVSIPLLFFCLYTLNNVYSSCGQKCIYRLECNYYPALHAMELDTVLAECKTLGSEPEQAVYIHVVV